MENIALWHERDISHSSVERNTLPDASATLHFMLYRATRLMDGLVINKEKMAHNLGLTRGLVFSEAVLLALVEKGLMRQQAYELVQRCAMKVGRDGSFKDELLKDSEVTFHISPDEIEKLFDLKHHLRHVDAIFKRAFGG
jgi:adenylosuccinate lyase